MSTNEEVAKKVAKVGLRVLKIAVKVGVTLAGFPECNVIITPLFSLAEMAIGIDDFKQSIDDANLIAEALEKIQEAITSLAALSRQYAKDLSQLVRSADHYSAVEYFINMYRSSTAETDLCMIGDPCCTSTLPYHLYALQNCITRSSPMVPNSESWITYICEHYQNNSTAEDTSWGFEPASQKFSEILLLQIQAVMVLKQLGRCSIDDYLTSIIDQAKMFLTEFKRLWNQQENVPVGTIKCGKLKPLPPSQCYGDISDGCFFRFVKGKSEPTCSILEKWDLIEGGNTIIYHSYTFDLEYMYQKESRILVYKKVLYWVDHYSKAIHKLTFSGNHDLKPVNHDDEEKYSCKSSLAIRTNNDEEYLCAVNKDGCIVSFSLTNNRLQNKSTKLDCTMNIICIPAQPHQLLCISSDTLYVWPYEFNHTKRKDDCDFKNRAGVCHGSYLYAIEKDELFAYENYYSDGISIAKLGEFITSDKIHLMQDGLSLYLQVNEKKCTMLYLIKPYWSDMFI
jgi:hypothetical protein